MSPLIMFGLVLILTFVVVLYFLSPTRAETDIQRHMAGIHKHFTVSADGGTILKAESLSSTRWLNELIAAIAGILQPRAFDQASGEQVASGSSCFQFAGAGGRRSLACVVSVIEPGSMHRRGSCGGPSPLCLSAREAERQT